MRLILRGEPRADSPPPIGKAALIESAGGQRGYADWTNPDHRLRRLLSEFLIGPSAGAVLAVGVAYVLRGPAGAGEATAAEGTPLHRATEKQEAPVPASRRPG